MPLPNPTYLVRHGRDYSDGRPELSGKGVQQARQARDTLTQLAAQRVAEKALILSAGGLRVIQTAQILRDGFKAQHIETATIIGSAGFNHQGAAPSKEVDLDEMVGTELEAFGYRLPEFLVVVTNAPLIALARGLTLPDSSSKLDELVPYGSVTPYEPGEWGRLYGSAGAD